MITETRSLDKYRDYEIGRGTYGQPEILWPSSKLRIGKFCSISTRVRIFLGGNHNVKWSTTYPLHQLYELELEGHPSTNGDVIIGNDVWIGEGVTILSGSKIGDGAVIGAGAIVAGEISDYVIAVGNPAQIDKLRFNAGIVARLKALKWWDWEDEKIRSKAHLLCSPLTLDILTKLEEVD